MTFSHWLHVFHLLVMYFRVRTCKLVGCMVNLVCHIAQVVSFFCHYIYVYYWMFKNMRRLYCLHKLRSLSVNQSILSLFYWCFFESVFTFGFIRWYGGLNVKNKNVLDRVVKVCGKVTGEKQKSMSELYECRVVQKAILISKDTTHLSKALLDSSFWMPFPCPHIFNSQN